MRELREFRAAHDAYEEAGIAVAGISDDTIESNARWSKRLDLPYPLLSDRGIGAGDWFKVRRRIGIAGWGIDLFRRTTFLVDRDGVIAAVWGNVKIRGHAAQVLTAAKALGRAV